MTDARILVVDDDLMNRSVTAGMLSRLGFEPAAAESGEEGLARIERETFHLVLLDIEMPGMDGFQVLSRIREREGGESHLPVVAVTGRAGGRPEEYLAAGFDGYLAKPFLPEQLAETIRRSLGRRAP